MKTKLDSLIRELELPSLGGPQDAITVLRRLELRGNQLAACLKKYRARYTRYSGMSHAVKDHQRSGAALAQWAAIFTTDPLPPEPAAPSDTIGSPTSGESPAHADCIPHGGENSIPKP